MLLSIPLFYVIEESSFYMAKFDFRRLSARLFSNLPPEEKRITISTLFTIARIVMTPFIVGAMITNHWGVAFWLFVISALFDVVDGNLARLLNERTFLGACLDPVADKLLLVSCFATLAFIETPLFSIPLWFVLLILFKEVAVLGSACIIFIAKGRLNVQPTILGKTTTVAQILFIIWLFACYFFGWMPTRTYYIALGALFVLVVLSLIQYTIIGFEQWTGKKL